MSLYSRYVEIYTRLYGFKDHCDAQHQNVMQELERELAVDTADAERYRLIRSKLCNRESLVFERIPTVLNLAGLAGIKPSEIDEAVDHELE